ncbi:MAG: hypothetical protein OEY18_12915 [Candidatus Aminicenantes bacterium]|nr:hypothetical protein [Candidatus Aminicenantes bacterium]MDH5385601.1 hypothetical protein [Candidatus Aminicenantes bacterium]MDH5742867.1 hypothetical protein [Candidatus Aminicenantes bacterium]
MRKWLFFLAVLAVVYAISQTGRRKQDRSPFLKRLSETVSIVVWVLLAAYAISFLYWLYKEIFR